MMLVGCVTTMGFSIIHCSLFICDQTDNQSTVYLLHAAVLIVVNLSMNNKRVNQ